MFEKQKKYKILFSITLMGLLSEKNFKEITADNIINNSNIKISNYNWMAHNKFDLLKTYFENANDQIISEAFKDFQDDNMSSTNEKLTDIILRFCEFHQNYKKSIKTLYDLKFSNRTFWGLFFSSIKDLSSKSLKISGGKRNDFRDDLILLGLISTYSLILDKWISYQDEDMSYIMKIADKYINNAQDFAANLKII